MAWNLRRLRVARRLTQEALGHTAGFDPSYIGRIERGKENVTIETLEALADALQSAMAEFFVVPEPGAESPGTMPRGRKPEGKSPPR